MMKMERTETVSSDSSCGDHQPGSAAVPLLASIVERRFSGMVRDSGAGREVPGRHGSEGALRGLPGERRQSCGGMSSPDDSAHRQTPAGERS